MSNYILQCTVCGLKFDITKDEVCPYCEWQNTWDEESENDYNPINGMTQKTARDRYKRGLNVFGNPLPKVRPKDEEGELFVPESSYDKK